MQYMKNSFCEWPFITLIHYFLTTWDVEKHSSHASSPRLHFLVIAHFRLIKLACEQALWGALAAGWEKQGELTTTSMEFAFHLQFPCGSPSTELSDFCQSAWSGNKCERKKNIEKHVPRVMTSLLMSSLPISILHWLFWCRYSNSRAVVASSPSFSLPAATATATESLLAGYY